MPEIKIGQYGEDVINWLTDNLEGFFDWLTTLLSHLLRFTYDIVAGLQPIPMTIVFAVIALVVTRRIGLTVLLTAGLLLVDGMGLWYETMQSLATVLLATAVALLIGIPVGIWSAFNRWSGPWSGRCWTSCRPCPPSCTCCRRCCSSASGRCPA